MQPDERDASAPRVTVVVMTRDAINHPDQVDLGRRLFDTVDGSKKIHVCLRGPYDRGMLGDVDETVMTYGDPVVSLQALAHAFAGE